MALIMQGIYYLLIRLMRKASLSLLKRLLSILKTEQRISITIFPIEERKKLKKEEM
jgi:hypothetical protein